MAEEFASCVVVRQGPNTMNGAHSMNGAQSIRSPDPESIQGREPEHAGLAHRMMRLLETQEHGRQQALRHQSDAQERSVTVMSRILTIADKAQTMGQLRREDPEAHKMLETDRVREKQKRRRRRQKNERGEAKAKESCEIGDRRGRGHKEHVRDDRKQCDEENSDDDNKHNEEEKLEADMQRQNSTRAPPSQRSHARRKSPENYTKQRSRSGKRERRRDHDREDSRGQRTTK